jgi:hypothetical protein
VFFWKEPNFLMICHEVLTLCWSGALHFPTIFNEMPFLIEIHHKKLTITSKLARFQYGGIFREGNSATI